MITFFSLLKKDAWINFMKYEGLHTVQYCTNTSVIWIFITSHSKNTKVALSSFMSTCKYFLLQHCSLDAATRRCIAGKLPIINWYNDISISFYQTSVVREKIILKYQGLIYGIIILTRSLVIFIVLLTTITLDSIKKTGFEYNWQPLKSGGNWSKPGITPQIDHVRKQQLQVVNINV